MRNKIKVLSIMLIGILLCGCGGGLSFKLPESHIYLKEGKVKEGPLENSIYNSSVIFDGREYVLYGEASGVKSSDIKECVGYVPGDGTVYFEYFVLTLKDSPDFLLLYDDSPGVRGIGITVYRAIDTRGKAIDIPDKITATTTVGSLNKFWSNEVKDNFEVDER